MPGPRPCEVSSVGSWRAAGALPASTSACCEPKARSAWRRTERSCRRLYTTTPATTAAPITSRPNWRSVMKSGRQLLPHAQGLVDIHRHHARDTRLGHRHPDQLLGHLHGDLVVADDQELGLARHVLDQVA